MPTPDNYRMLAAYNSWMNDKLYAGEVLRVTPACGGPSC